MHVLTIGGLLLRYRRRALLSKSQKYTYVYAYNCN
jgi:hypothetical protein